MQVLTFPAVSVAVQVITLAPSFSWTPLSTVPEPVVAPVSS